MKRNKAGKFEPNYTQKEFDLLVNTIRFGRPVDVYTYLDKISEDERTKWRTFDRAIKKAREVNTR